MSTSIAHRSGTLLSASPPRIRPRLIEGRSNSSELCRANGSDSMLRKTSCALSTALSPSHGVAPWAATPPTSSRSASTPFASTPICRSVGSPVIAKSPMKPLSTRWSLPRSLSSSDSSSPTMPEPHPDPVLVPHRGGGQQHRRQRPLHVVGAAPVEPVALDPRVELPGRARGRRRGARAGRPSARPRARPRPSAPAARALSASVASIPRASSQPLTNPAASSTASGSEVS